MSNAYGSGENPDPLGNSQSVSPQFVPPITPPPLRSKRIVIAALTVSIVAFLGGWIPVLGLLLGAAGITLGVIALVKRQSKGLAITSLVLASLAFLTSTVMTIAVASGIPTSTSTTVAVPAETEVAAAPDETTEPEVVAPEAEPEPEPAGPDLASFGEMDERTFALLGKEPDAHVGENLIVYGTVFQFDSFTGTCSFMANTSNASQTASYDYAQNTLVVAGDEDTDCPILTPIVEGDHVKMWVTVQGSYTYDTQIGGTTNALALEALQMELLPATEY